MTSTEALVGDLGMKEQLTMEDEAKGQAGHEGDDEQPHTAHIMDLSMDQQETGDNPATHEANWGSPLFVSDRDMSENEEEVYEALNEKAVMRNGIAIVAPPLKNAWEYLRYEEEEGPIVEQILEQYNDGGSLQYLVQYDDGLEEVVSLRYFPPPCKVLPYGRPRQHFVHVVILHFTYNSSASVFHPPHPYSQRSLQ